MEGARNHEVSAAWEFHAATKYVQVPGEDGRPTFAMGTPPHVEDPIWQQDWSLEPYPFKLYETAPATALTREFAPSELSGLEALSRTGLEPAAAATKGGVVPTRETLARIGLHANGRLNRYVPSRDGTREFRTAGATGARYHLELYFVCADLDDLGAGVYHYDAHDHCLRQLRAGDFRGVLVEASGTEPAVADAPVVLAVTSTFWRNAWRYKARSYRHAYWDAGTSLSQVLAVAASARVPARLVMGFADDRVNELLDVDGHEEATLALCALGTGRRAEAEQLPATPPLDLPTRAISPRRVTFPAIPAMHAASRLASGADAAAWRSRGLRRTAPPVVGPLVPLRPLARDEYDHSTAEELVFRRRSTRHYDAERPTSFEAFSTVLDVSSRGFAADWLPPGALPLHDCHLIVNQVDGLAPGLYRHRPDRCAVELLRTGDYRCDAQRLAVGQAYTAHAHVNAYYLAELGPVLRAYGNRGYRLAQLGAALTAGKLHLATHALGLGAVGSTSLDDEVTEFFGPTAAEASYLFVTVFGRRRSRQRRTSP